MDVRVDDHHDPVEELARLVGLHTAFDSLGAVLFAPRVMIGAFENVSDQELADALDAVRGSTHRARRQPRGSILAGGAAGALRAHGRGRGALRRDLLRRGSTGVPTCTPSRESASSTSLGSSSPDRSDPRWTSYPPRSTAPPGSSPGGPPLARTPAPPPLLLPAPDQPPGARSGPGLDRPAPRAKALVPTPPTSVPTAARTPPASSVSTSGSRTSWPSSTRSTSPRPYHVVGGSLGGSLAVCLAERRPSRCSRSPAWAAR